MAREGERGSGGPGDRLIRGFEDLVGEEGFLPAPQAMTPAPDLQRVDSLEYRVRVTMDRLTELVEAQLPEAVDGLRADFERLRAQLPEAVDGLRAEFERLHAEMAEERFQLRSQIATTVGAANRWFVRTRDQLFERLDEVARAAAAAQAEAELAASAAVAAAVPVPAAPEQIEEPPLEVAAEPVAEDFDVAAEPVADEGAAPAEPADEFAPDEFAAEPEPAGDEFAAEPEPAGDEFVPPPEPVADEFAAPPEPVADEFGTPLEPEVAEEAPPHEEPAAGEPVELEWGVPDVDVEEQAAPVDVGQADTPTQEVALAPGYDFELDQPPAPTPVAVALETPELDALLEPIREDLRELQGEISAMGAAVLALREDVEQLGRRLPSRAASPRLAPSQLDAIVAAVQSALPPASARARSATKAAAAKAATAAPAAKATRTRATATKAAASKAGTRAATTGRSGAGSRVGAAKKSAAGARAATTRAAKQGVAPSSRRRTPST